MLHTKDMKYQVKKNLGSYLRHGGAEFCVWAPFAEKVSLVGSFSEQPVDMTSDGNGYWEVFAKGVEAGQGYHYLIEHEGQTLTRNDPYARQLTSSDKGMSVIVDHDFEWGDDLFMPVPKEKQVIYELHIGTFHRPDTATAGTFYTAIEKLDYLQSLGVNMVELMPVTSMAFSNGWGYAPNYLFSVENAYGGRHGLMRFVRACHEKGIGVILDVVYNHFSSESGLWQFDGWSENDRGGIYFYNDERGDTPWGGRPDYGRPEVRQFVLDNVAMWTSEYRLDGLRVDSTIYMRNTAGQNDDPAHDIGDAWRLLADITTLAHKINPGALIIAEDMSANTYLTKSKNSGGCGFDAQWELGLPHGLRDAFGFPGRNKTLDTVVYELGHKFNDDAFARIVFSDSHDTAANGSTRLNEATTPGNASSLQARQNTLIGSALALTIPGIPMLLQGQEFMQEGAFNDWQGLEWDKTTQFSGMVTAHKHLIDLRQNRHGGTAGLLGQNVRIFHRDDTNFVLGYHRWQNGGSGDDVVVVVNFGSSKFVEYHLQLPVAGAWSVCFNSSWKGYGVDFPELMTEHVTTTDQGDATIGLAKHAVVMFTRD